MIYFYHIQGTGGRSVIEAFLHQSGTVESFHPFFFEFSTIVVDDKKFQRTSMPDPDTYFAASHIAYRRCSLPKDIDTFRFTLMRDPIARFAGRYRHHYRFSRIGTHTVWKGDNIIDVVNSTPRFDVMNQLGMFSDSYNVNEAVINLRKLDVILRCETMAETMEILSQRLQLDPPLQVFEKRNSLLLSQRVTPQQIQEDRETVAAEVDVHYDFLREKLDLEYQLMEALGI